MTDADWADPNALAIALYLDGSDDPDQAADGTWLTDADFLVMVNAWWEPLDFALPATRPEAGWQPGIDTYDPASQAGPADSKAGDHITVGPRSVVVLQSPLAQTE
jgi:isoamylase